MKLVDSERWSWILYHYNDDYIVSVVCGTVGIFTREILLTNEETSAYINVGRTFIDDLAKQIRNHVKVDRALTGIDYKDIKTIEAAVNKYKASNSKIP